MADKAYFPVYDPDGRWIYFTQGRLTAFRLMRVGISPEGAGIGEPELLKSTGALLYKHVAFSANGRLMTYTAEAAVDNLWQVHMSPQTREVVGSPEPFTRDTNGRKTYPVFSPDGGKVSFKVLEVGSDWSLQVVDANGGNTRSLGTATTVTEIPGWFPGGQRLATIIVGEHGQRDLESVDVDSGRKTLLRELTANDTSARLSPDGKQIAYNSRQGGSMNIWTAPVDVGPAKQLTFDKESASFPAWSPDGKWIAERKQFSRCAQRMRWLPLPVNIAQSLDESWLMGGP